MKKRYRSSLGVTFTLLLLAVGQSSIPYAAASPGLLVDWEPETISPGSDSEWSDTSFTGPADVEDPFFGLRQFIVVQEPGDPAPAVANDVTECASFTGPKVYDMVADGGVTDGLLVAIDFGAVTAGLSGMIGAGNILAPFPLSTSTFGPGATFVTFMVDDGGGLDPYAGDARFENVNDASVLDTDYAVGTIFHKFVCSFLDLNGDNDFDVDDLPNIQADTLTFITPPTQVGGELIPIDNTALLLAGIQGSAIWMIPTLAGLAGSGFYLVKFRTNKE